MSRAAGWIVLGAPPARPAGAAEAARYGDASELGCLVNRAHAGAGTGGGTHTRAVRPCEAPNKGTRGEARKGGWAGREEVSPRRPGRYDCVGPSLRLPGAGMTGERAESASAVGRYD